jgi:inner membrane organizing system protein 1
MSEALLNEKACDHAPILPSPADSIVVIQWDHCLSTMLIRSTLGASFGVIFSVLLFKRRAWPAFVGLGFGAGRAWEECDNVRLVF